MGWKRKHIKEIREGNSPHWAYIYSAGCVHHLLMPLCSWSSPRQHFSPPVKLCRYDCKDTFPEEHGWQIPNVKRNTWSRWPFRSKFHLREEFLNQKSPSWPLNFSFFQNSPLVFKVLVRKGEGKIKWPGCHALKKCTAHAPRQKRGLHQTCVSQWEVAWLWSRIDRLFL